MPGPGSVACPKPRRQDREKEERRDARKEQTRQEQVRAYVLGREREICRICRARPAESVHELRPRSIGGKVSRVNSVAVCGLLVGASPSCHTYAQAHQIWWRGTALGAEGTLWFTPKTEAAAEWMKVKLGQEIESEPMVLLEAQE